MGLWPQAPRIHPHHHLGKGHAQGTSLLLREHPQAEVIVLEGLEGGQHHQVLPRGEPGPGGDHPQVDIGGGSGRGLVAQVRIHVPLKLQKEQWSASVPLKPWETRAEK